MGNIKASVDSGAFTHFIVANGMNGDAAIEAGCPAPVRQMPPVMPAMAMPMLRRLETRFPHSAVG